MQNHIKNIPSVRTKNNLVMLRNEYWESIHDAEQGGAIVSLRFFNGTGENILRKPIHAHVAVGEGKKVVFYRQSFCRNTQVKTRSTPSSVQVVCNGRFYDEFGNGLPVAFCQRYEYRAWGLVKASIEFVVEKKLERVYEFSPCNFYLSPAIDTIGYRPSTPSALMQDTIFCRWEEVGFNRSYRDSRDPVPERLIPIYFCAMQRGVEGLEFYRGSDSVVWNRPFGLPEEGRSIFTHERGLKNDYFYIRCESYCDWSNPGAFKAGRQAWEYYLGLPFVKDPEKTGNVVFHAWTDSNWPADTALESLSKQGVKLLRHHDDNTFKPKGWPDGKYPPYAPEDMRELDRVIATAHRLGMKITPYFSLKEFHPSCPVYAKKAREWKRQIDRSGMILGEDGPFGGYMCMKSGWLEYRKKSIDLVLKKHAFDGVYYDHMWFHICRHPEHCAGRVHTDVDEVLDFYFWTRARVGDKGIMFIHCSGTPSMVAENMADLVFVSEDYFSCRPLPGGFDPLCEFVPITPRHTVSTCGNNSPEPEIYRPQHLACLLEGWPPYPGIINQTDNSRFLMAEIAKFKGYDLGKLRFIPARRSPLKTGVDKVYASVYFNDRVLLVYCANLGGKKQTARLRWSDAGRERFKRFLPFKPAVKIPPYSSILMEIKA